jgi:2,3-bisphosphoglycerate-independent phosphoglycerate mutase
MLDFLFKKNTKSVGISSAEISNAQTKLVVLMILDGLGITSDEDGNSVLKAKTPFLDTVWTKGRKTLLHASGTPVGLPDGEVGNSEVGHLNIGAGRVVYQSLPRINDAIMSGQFKKHPVFLDALKEAKKRGSKVHLMGILSAGGVHGHISHLFELLEMCKDNGVEPYVHAFLDGRDTGMTDGYFYVSKLMSKMKELKTGKLASLIGRFYAMDRDNRWERINLAYDAMTGKGKRTAKDPFEIIQEAYKKSENDQIFVPTTMVDDKGKPVGAIEDRDIAIIFNFREDRSREIIKAFVQKDS